MRSCYGRGAPLRAGIYVACLSAFLFFGYGEDRQQSSRALSSILTFRRPRVDFSGETVLRHRSLMCDSVFGGILQDKSWLEQFGYRKYSNATCGGWGGMIKGCLSAQGRLIDELPLWHSRPLRHVASLYLHVMKDMLTPRSQLRTSRPASPLARTV